MSILDKVFGSFMDKDKAKSLSLKDPREVFAEVLKQASGTTYTRKLNFNIYYQVIAFYGIAGGIGTSSLVANTALAIAKLGLTVCVIDTSILHPSQDVLLKTEKAVMEDSSKKYNDWFSMPFERTSPMYVSKLNGNISILSFKNKNRGVVDMLSTRDSELLVDIALSIVHNKFDIVLIDCCHELTAVNTACLQRAQKVIQVWNDAPVALSNLESHISTAVTLSCSLDKMRSIVVNRACREIIGGIDELVKQYRCEVIAKNYLSEELYLLSLSGKPLYQAESNSQSVSDYTECIIDIAFNILGAPRNTDLELEV